MYVVKLFRPLIYCEFVFFIFNKVHCKTSHSFLYSLCSLMTNVVMVCSNKHNQINSAINISNSLKTYLVNTFFNMIDSLNIEINMQDVSNRGSENTFRRRLH